MGRRANRAYSAVYSTRYRAAKSSTCCPGVREVVLQLVPQEDLVISLVDLN